MISTRSIESLDLIVASPLQKPLYVDAISVELHDTDQTLTVMNIPYVIDMCPVAATRLIEDDEPNTSYIELASNRTCKETMIVIFVFSIAVVIILVQKLT